MPFVSSERACAVAKQGAHLVRIEDALFEAAARQPTKTALVDHTWSLDYRGLEAWVQQFADKLREHGLCRGDRVAVFFDQTPEAVVALYGIWTAGGIAVPVNGGLRSRQVEHIVRHSGSKFISTTKRKVESLDHEAVAGSTVLHVEALSTGRIEDGRVSSQDQHDLAAILYTSGSTGLPKGVAVSHRNLRAGVRIVTNYLNIQEEERILGVLPFSFDYGLNQLLTTVGRGATLVLQRSPLPADICRALKTYEITGLAGVPPLWIELVQKSSPFSRWQFPQLRYMTNSGGQLPVTVVEALRRAVPHAKLYLMYGLTEAFRSTYLAPEELDRRPQSMGKAIPESEIYVVSPEGRLTAPGEVGELVHSGPTVALGYWQDPEATARKFRPHPFGGNGERVVYSGDFVSRDEAGFLYYVGRRDEMIKTLGYRVSPTEVEEVIYRSGMIAEVVVKGASDVVCGAIVVAHCVPARPEEFSIDDMLSYCRKEMPGYMVPKSVVVHTCFPRTTSGKIDRKAVGQ